MIFSQTLTYWLWQMIIFEVFRENIKMFENTDLKISRNDKYYHSDINLINQSAIQDHAQLSSSNRL